MPERSIGAVSKTVVRASVPWVRIPPSPPTGDDPHETPVTVITANPLVFMHIPKTSGSALVAALATDGADTVRGFDRSIFGGFDDFATLASPITATIAFSPADLPSQPSLVAGHFALSTLRAAYPTAPLFTLWREPRSRLLSHWLYWRALTDADTAAWGTWAERLRSARLPLADFLDCPAVACQTDNVVTRMLLWPYPLIPADSFIHHRHDRILLSEARRRLEQVDFVDLLENPDFPQNLRKWSGRPFDQKRENVTETIPEPFRSPLPREFTPHCLLLLADRCRLDNHLWRHVAKARLRDQDVEAVRQSTLLANIARYALLMVPTTQPAA